MTGPRVEVGVRVEARADVVAAAQLLALPAADVGVHLRAAMDRTPALVVRERPVCPHCGRAGAGGPCAECRHPALHSSDGSAAVDQPWTRLERDLAVTLPPDLLGAGRDVLAALDDHGLLPPGRPAGMSREARDRVVAALRAVGPPGIAAATVEEGLLLQLRDAPLDDRERDLARLVLGGEHAGLLARDGPAAAAAAAGCSPTELAALLRRLSRLLRPYPMDTSGPPAPPAPPDLLFEIDGAGVRAVLPERGRWSVEVAAGTNVPIDAVRAARDEARALHERLNRRWTLLERLGAVLAAEHGVVLRAGSTAFSSFTQATAAARLGVHESTVSRCVRHRTARLPDGTTVALRRLFGTGHDVRDQIARLCAAEPRPSDREIAAVLAGRGHRVARRTVAKYRAQLTG